ncbi:MAG: hypothetical protein PUF37_05100 [Prevotellaceae bacterium]|nr:hypothetical protein [Prevotellaceae bacterium]
MKKIAALLFAFLMTLTASAQFEQGKAYIGASLTGLDLNYRGHGANFGAQAKGGYLVADNLMLLGEASYQHVSDDNVADEVTVGAQGRYYIIQNGLYLGAGVKLLHANHDYNDVMPGLEVGYAFFLNGSVTVEPAIYYDQSFKNHSDYSTIGFKVGIGIYL